LAELGFKEIKIGNSKLHPLTDILKRARTEIDLNLNIRKLLMKYMRVIVFHLLLIIQKHNKKLINVYYFCLLFFRKRDC